MKRHRKHKFLEEIKKTPIIEVACKNTGISRQTFYRWCKDFPDFQKEFNEAYNNYGVANINDICESKLLKKIQNDNFQAIKYWLDHHHIKYMKNKNYDNVLNDLYLIKQSNKNISLEDALKIAEENVIQSVQTGNIKDSKYLLEKRNTEYSPAIINQRGLLSAQDIYNITEEEINKMVEVYKKLGVDKDIDNLKNTDK